MLTLEALCERLSITHATGRNWLRLGKLSPVNREGPPLFEEAYAERLLCGLSDGGAILIHRRNKTALSGRTAYSPFREELSPEAVSLLEEIAVCREISAEDTGVILAAWAVHSLLEQPLATPGQSLRVFFDSPACLGIYAPLVWDLLEDASPSAFPEVLEREILPQQGDFLGALYLSLRERGGRQAAGAFYTPKSLIGRVLEALEAAGGLENKTVLDPCCGSGGFLMAAAEKCGDLSGIYGRDIDPMAVKLARINLAIRFRPESIRCLWDNVRVADTLLAGEEARYDVILGNPPWGYRYGRSQREAMVGCYRVGDQASSCDLFVESGLRGLNRSGLLCYLLPEAMLHVERHEPARRLLLEEGTIRAVEYLGEAFPGVQCPAILLCVEKGGKARSITVSVAGSRHMVSVERPLLPHAPCLNARDEEYEILTQMAELEGARFLRGNADFALGIVTGNNRQLLAESPGPGLEPVLRGREVTPFAIATPARYLAFRPERFQQCAPEKRYRAPEKLVYRFVGQRPIFALDQSQLLTLNSCNVLIPRLEGIDIAYVLAVLNSRAVAFFCGKRFRSVKLLRSHIEAIPIPVAAPERMARIAAWARQLSDRKDAAERHRLYEALDSEMMELFGLAGKQREIVQALEGSVPKHPK